MIKEYDLIIIGSGPAGLTAAIYASRAQLDFIVIEKSGMSGGQIINTYEVDNYPGVPNISGFELASKFRAHCDNQNVVFITGDVTGFSVEGEIKTITMDEKETYSAKTLIISTGAVYRKLGVKGEEELLGMGVSYCATCDGAFFKNKIVAVVGGGDVAVEDAIFLSRICNKVYVIHRRNEFRAAKSLINNLINLENVEILWDSTVEEITGTDVVGGIVVKSLETSEHKNLKVDGIFIAVGNMPSSDIYKEFVATDSSGYIIAGENCETNVKGIYAAGDIRTKELRQVITAAADGANAITAVERYLNSY